MPFPPRPASSSLIRAIRMTSKPSCLIFLVNDNGKTYTAAMFGGTMMGSVLVDPDELLAQYGKSITHFKEETKKAKVEVEFQIIRCTTICKSS